MSNPRIVPSQILDARKKRKKNISFRRSFQRVPIARLCGKSRLDSRIFGRIFRETRLLRIIQTNHEFSMNSRLGINPLFEYQTLTVCHRIRPPFQIALNIPQTHFPPFVSFFNMFTSPRQKPRQRHAMPRVYFTMEWNGRALLRFFCPVVAYHPCSRLLHSRHVVNASEAILRTRHPSIFIFGGGGEDTAYQPAYVTVSLVARVVNHGYTRRLHILARLLVRGSISGTRGSWFRGSIPEEEKSTFRRTENTERG